MNKAAFLVYFDLLDQMETLSMEERGELFTAMLQYAKSGTEPQKFSSDGVRIAFSFVKVGIRENLRKYQAKCEQNRQNRKGKNKNAVQDEYSDMPF